MELIKAIFLERINRFVVRAKIEDKEVLAYLPNPGRLWELLLPGRELLLKAAHNNAYKYTVIACYKENIPVLLHTHLTNDYIKELLLQGRVQFLSNYEFVGKEPKIGKSRLDFLLRNRETEKELFLEVKTCTLFGSKLAMFPDAETKRGTKHLYELAKLASQGKEAGCLFVVMSPYVEYFLPAYHIDQAFTQAFLETYSLVKYVAIGISFNEDFTKVNQIKPLKIPIELLKEEFKNSGSYLVILEVKSSVAPLVGHLGEIPLKKGYYVYVGSAKKNLYQRINRYLRKNKKKFWHIDYLLDVAKIYKIVPILSSKSWECEIASELSNFAETSIKNFGASDCNCKSHLLYFPSNPLLNPHFINLINYFRLEKPCLLSLKSAATGDFAG
ncbi:MAG: DNA/RNA nuclease SfsA [Caldimicrobium sp.]